MGKEFIFLSHCHVTTYSNSDNFASRFLQTRADDVCVGATTQRREPQHKRTGNKMESSERLDATYRQAIANYRQMIQICADEVEQQKRHKEILLLRLREQEQTIIEMRESMSRMLNVQNQLRAELSEAKQAVLLGILDC